MSQEEYNQQTFRIKEDQQAAAKVRVVPRNTAAKIDNFKPQKRDPSGSYAFPRIVNRIYQMLNSKKLNQTKVHERKKGRGSWREKTSFQSIPCTCYCEII